MPCIRQPLTKIAMTNSNQPPHPITDEVHAVGTGDTSVPFPIECLPSAMRNMVLETAKQTRTPHALAAVVAIGVASAAIGRGLLVKSGGSRITAPNLYLLAIARSGVGKGQTFSHVSKPLYAAEAEVVDEWKTSRKSNIEASLDVAKGMAKRATVKATTEVDDETRKSMIETLAALDREQKRLEHELDSCPCYVVADITREALAMRLASQSNESLASFSPEARGILGVVRGRYGHDGTSDEDIYLSAYSGEPINVHRVKREPVSLKNPCLTIVWMTQPDAARDLLADERMTVSGLLPRFLMCDVKAELQHEPELWPEMDPAVVESWSALVKALLGYRTNGMDPIVIDATDDARKVLREFTNEAVDRAGIGGDLRDVDSYAARWGENAWRLALTLHGAEHGGDVHRMRIGKEAAENAVAILRWFAREQLAILAASRSDRFKVRLTKLLGILRDAGGSKTLGQIWDANGFEEAEVRSLAARYPLQIIVEKLDKPGRPCFVAKFAPTPINPQKPENAPTASNLSGLSVLSASEGEHP